MSKFKLLILSLIVCKSHATPTTINNNDFRKSTINSSILFNQNTIIINPKKKEVSSKKESNEKTHVSVIGAGLAGITTAIKLSQLGYKVSIFESSDCIVNGSSKIPAHIYTGPMYMDKGQETIKECMQSANDFMNTYDFLVNKRPTIAAIGLKDSRTPEQMIEACEVAKKYYIDEISDEDKSNIIDIDNYYEIFYKEDLVNTEDLWLKNFSLYTDLDKIKFPIVKIQEYGLDMRRARAYFSAIIKNINIDLYLNSKVDNIEQEKNYLKINFNTMGKTDSFKSDWVINAAGAGASLIDKSMGIVHSRVSDHKIAGLFGATYDMF